ncbi:MAG TPA: hypothetical protein VIV11_35865 [Kofleriaceae bacterium]
MRKLIIVSVLVVAASAQAEPPKYTRKQTVQVEVKLSNRVKPAKPASSEPAGPIPADGVLAIMERAQPLRREQEALLERLIRDAPDSDEQKPDYMFRLAEHYAQQLRFWRIKAIEPTVRRAR